LDDIKNISIKILNAYEPIAVLTHYDSDGLAAGGAMSRFLLKSEKLFILRSTHMLSEDVLNSFFSIRAKTFLILDMGSGDLKLIYKKWKKNGGRLLIIIDHHKIQEEIPEDTRVNILNPELYGFDGGRIGSTSILCSLVGYYGLGEKDKYFLEIGVVGASGDMQIQNGVEGINNFLLKLAEENGVVKKEREFVFFIHNKLPVFKAIVNNLVPYIPGFTYREDVGLNIVRKAGIKMRKRGGEYITLDEISEEEKSKLLEIITKYIASLGIDELDTSSFLTDVYYLPLEKDPVLLTAMDFSNLLSSCGRLDREDIGISIASGARGRVLEIGKSILVERKKILAKYLERAEKSLEQIDGVIYLIDFLNSDFSPKFSGTISTIFSKSLKYKDKVIVVLSEDEEGNIKISSRAPREFVENGFDLSRVMKKLAETYGGRGGGHNIAAGASLPTTARKDVKIKIKEIVLEEMKVLKKKK
jgi:RecJ-like exonuclease